MKTVKYITDKAKKITVRMLELVGQYERDLVRYDEMLAHIREKRRECAKLVREKSKLFSSQVYVQWPDMTTDLLKMIEDLEEEIVDTSDYLFAVEDQLHEIENSLKYALRELR